jgi:hypothetical protein
MKKHKILTKDCVCVTNFTHADDGMKYSGRLKTFRQ